MASKKNANIELIRIISMLMIITLHTLYKGNLLGNLADMNIKSIVAWIIESVAIVGLNMFMLISGYLLVDSKFKCGRLLEIIFQILFYSIGVLAVLLILGERYTTYDYLQCIFPIHNNVYWFCTAYVLMYLFSPVLKRGIKKMKQKQLGAIIIVLLIYECAFKTLLPVRLEADKMGYDVIWFLIMFLVASYIKLYGLKLLKSAQTAWILHVIFTALIFAEKFVLTYINSKTGHFSDIVGVSFEYNHFFVLASSVSLFCALINMKPIEGKAAKVICLFAPLSFGVYLLHEQVLIRYEWPKWLQVSSFLGHPVYQFVAMLFCVVLGVYVIGAFVDLIRSFIFKGFKLLVSKTKLTAGLSRIDEAINREVADE